MKKLLVTVAAIAIISLYIATQNKAVITALIDKGVHNQLSKNVIGELEDGLHLAVCGAGGPLPAPKASGPCIAVVAGDKLFIVDAGTDGLRNLNRMGYSPGKIDALFLTHFHSDHIDGLGEMATMRWVSEANSQPLPVYGPRGVQQVVEGFNIAYALDVIYRNAHHGDSVAPNSGAGMLAQAFDNPPAGELLTLYQQGDIKVQALAVEHSPVDPAVGYKFTYKDRSLLISGDTIKSANIQHFSKGIDLLVHEALAPNLVNIINQNAQKLGNSVLEKITEDILDYHASPRQAAETARDAGVGHLLYYHIVPPMILPGQSVAYLDGAEDIFADYTIAEDGVAFSMPTGSDEIIKTRNGL